MPMPRSIPPFLCVLMATLLAAACGSDDPPPMAPDPISVTISFDGALGPNGGRTHPFEVGRGGAITTVLTELLPDSEARLGLSLGTWNGTVCQIILANDAATQGTQITGIAQSPGNFCVRIYDAAGELTQEATYQIAVTFFT